jgi:hypothetical protein
MIPNLLPPSRYDRRSKKEPSPNATHTRRCYPYKAINAAAYASVREVGDSFLAACVWCARCVGARDGEVEDIKQCGTASKRPTGATERRSL